MISAHISVEYVYLLDIFGPMNAKTYAQRTSILQQMAALHTMEEGSLKEEYRTGASGTKTGPYFKHQVWRDGANVSQRIRPEDVPPLSTAIANRQKFEALSAEFVKLTVADTRQNYLPEGLKKKISSASSPKRRRSPG